ncbi:MAG: ATP-binding protein [Anaerolineae bacterium]|nr:ATP-binding protein [Anaerolineae bacterium]
MTKTLQDILKRRQQEEFVGREEQLAFFRRNLRYEPDDRRRRFVISVSGQGGAGKTWLLRRFRDGFEVRITRPTSEKADGYLNRIDFYALTEVEADYPWKRYDSDCEQRFPPRPISHPGADLCAVLSQAPAGRTGGGG